MAAASFAFSPKIRCELIGSLLSIDCGEKCVYQGIVVEIDCVAQSITLDKPLYNGIPSRLSRLHLRSTDIVGLEVVKSANGIAVPGKSSSHCGIHESWPKAHHAKKGRGRFRRSRSTSSDRSSGAESKQRRTSRPSSRSPVQSRHKRHDSPDRRNCDVQSRSPSSRRSYASRRRRFARSSSRSRSRSRCSSYSSQSKSPDRKHKKHKKHRTDDSHHRHLQTKSDSRKRTASPVRSQLNVLPSSNLQPVCLAAVSAEGASSLPNTIVVPPVDAFGNYDVDNMVPVSNPSLLDQDVPVSHECFDTGFGHTRHVSNNGGSPKRKRASVDLPLPCIPDGPDLLCGIMQDPPAKQRKTVADSPLKAKVQNLPLLCIDTICKFTPTSKLIRLYSSAVPLPGALWSFGLGTALQKRLPFSLGDDLPYREPGGPCALFDVAGAKLGGVKQPAAFRLSPLSDLVEKALLTVRVARASVGALPHRPQLYILHGDALLSQLPHVTELTLVARELPSRNCVIDSRDLRAENLSHLLPQLASLAVDIGGEWRLSDLNQVVATVDRFMREMPIPAMSGLRRLTLPESAFHMQTVANSCAARRALAGLSSVGLFEEAQWPARTTRLERLRLVSTCCTRLSTLSVIVEGEFQPYLAAFRALTSLTLLGLRLFRLKLYGICFNQSEFILSVLDLRISKQGAVKRSRVVALATLFPNVKSIAFETPQEDYGQLVMAAKFCAQQVLPDVCKLSCSHPHAFSSCTSVRLIRFLRRPNLPAAVDLSSVTFARLATDSSLLTGIYRAMQANSIRSLILRGPMNRETLADLRRAVDSNGFTKVRAWTDRDLGEQLDFTRDVVIGQMLDHVVIVAPATQFSEATDVEIVGTKTSGVLKTEEFSIRVIHQLAKRSAFLDSYASYYHWV